MMSKIYHPVSLKKKKKREKYAQNIAETTDVLYCLKKKKQNFDTAYVGLV